MPTKLDNLLIRLEHTHGIRMTRAFLQDLIDGLSDEFVEKEDEVFFREIPIICDNDTFVQYPGDTGMKLVVFRIGKKFRIYTSGISTTPFSVNLNEWWKIISVEQFPELAYFKSDKVYHKAYIQNEVGDTESQFDLRVRIDAEGIFIRGKSATTTVGANTSSITFNDILFLSDTATLE